MAASLSDISKLLKDNNEEQTMVLQNIDKSTKLTAQSIGMLKSMFEKDKFKDLEEDLETKGEQRKIQSESSKGPSGKGGGLFSGFADMFPQGGLFGLGAALASQLPKFLLGRALPALLAKAFADEIADYIEDKGGSKDFADAIYRGLNLGALGLLFGKKFAALGFVTGMIMSPENRQKMEIEFENLEVNIAHFAGKIEDFFNIELPDLTETFSYIGGAPIKALEGLNAAFKGDGKGFVDSLDEMAVTLIGLAAIIRPGGTLRVIAKSIAGLGFAISALKNISLKGITASVAASTAAIASTTAGASTGVAIKSAQDLEDTIKRGTVDEKGMVRSKAGELYKADSPQGKAIVRAAQEAQIKINTNIDTSTKKFPRFALLRKVPLLGSLVSLGLIGSILTSDVSAEEKVSEVAGILGGVGGATLGSIMGAVAGIGLGPGALLTGLLGGAGGAIAGDLLAKASAQWLMNMPVDAFPDWTGLNEAFNGKASKGANVEFVPNNTIPGSMDELGSNDSTGYGAGSMFIPKPPKISSDDFRFFQQSPSDSGQAIVYAPVATDNRQFNSSPVALTAPLGVAQIDNGNSLLG